MTDTDPWATMQRLNQERLDASRPGVFSVSPTRPPIERYLRCSLTFGAWTVEPGLQYDRGEKLSALLGQLQRAVGEAWNAASPVDIDDVPKLNDAVEAAVMLLWPDRAWFVGVHHDVAGWTQIYQPYGVPRWR